MNTMNITFINGKADDAYVARIDALGFLLVGVPRDKIAQACNCKDIPSQGIYFLVNTKESSYKPRYLYVGQTKTGPNRLIDHKTKKPDWDMAYMFLASKFIFPLQIIDELEALEIEKYKDIAAFNLVNEKPNRAIPDVSTMNIANQIEEIMSFLGYGIESSLSCCINDTANVDKLENNIDNYRIHEDDSPHTQLNYNNYNSLHIDDCGDLAYKTPVYCKFNDNEYDLTKIKEYSGFRTLIYVCGLELNKIDHDKLQDLANKKIGRGKSAKKPFISCSSYDLRAPIKITNSIFIEGNVSHNDACKTICILLNEFKFDTKCLTFKVTIDNE